MDGLLELKEGSVFTVPHGFARQICHSRRCDKNTPRVLRLKRVKRVGERVFEIRTVNDDIRRDPSEYGGKVLFTPANISPGDQLRVEWVDPNCACAVWAN